MSAIEFPSTSSSHERRIRVENVNPQSAAIVAILPTAATAVGVALMAVFGNWIPLPKPATLLYGLANLAVVGVLFAWLPAGARDPVFSFDRPTRRALVAAVVLAVLAVGIVAPVVVRAAAAVGVGGGPSVPRFDSPLGAVVVAGTSVLVAPVVEEVLFRGLLLGSLVRRYRVGTAIVASSALFGGIHVFVSGLPGVVEAFLVGVGFAWLRLRAGTLSSVALSHALVNAYYVGVGVGLVPSLLGG